MKVLLVAAVSGGSGQSWTEYGTEIFCGDVVQKQMITKDRKEADLELVYMED